MCATLNTLGTSCIQAAPHIMQAAPYMFGTPSHSTHLSKHDTGAHQHLSKHDAGAHQHLNKHDAGARQHLNKHDTGAHQVKGCAPLAQLLYTAPLHRRIWVCLCVFMYMCVCVCGLIAVRQVRVFSADLSTPLRLHTVIQLLNCTC